jgi:PKD repeat protein
LLALAALTAPAIAQMTLTAPAGYSATIGSSNNIYPWGRNASSMRYQQIYDSTNFTSQGANYPIVIQGMKFRPYPGATTTWTGGTWPNIQIDLATSPVDFLAASATFASNLGPDLTTVLNGPVTVNGGTTLGTGVVVPWHIDIPFTTPFVYDPTSGNDLTFDVYLDGTGWTGTSRGVDAVTGTAALGSRIYNTTGLTSATGTVGTNYSLICEFTYVPAAGLYPGFGASTTTGNSPLSVNFTDQSFSSAPGGVLAWQWDLDGDNLIDSTVQNPTFVYQSCGTYSVSLTVVDALHPLATLTRTGYITVDPLSASFSASSNGGFAPVTVNFTDTSTGPVAAWQWDFDGDNVIDSTVQNPTWIYGAPGNYTVSLTVVNSCRVDTRTRTNLITVLAPGTMPAPPELLQYQFNEVRGQEIANTAATNTAPAQATVGVANWWTDPGRTGFRGNEPGFGCLGYRAAGAGYVNTGIPTSFTGSFTISFWLRRDPLSTTTNPFGYAFGNGTFRAFAAGAAGQGITFRGSAIGNVDSVFPVTGTPGVWQHLTLVVDDAAGQALWYDNGTASTNVVSFTPNTFSYVSATLFGVGAMNTTGTSPIGAHYDMDDFRFYTRALLPAEVLVCSLSPENASAGASGLSCPGTLGTPTIGSTGGNPTQGNAAFAVTLGNAENNRLAAIAGGFTPASFGTFDLSPWIGAGCVLQNDAIALSFTIVNGNGASQNLPIPAAGLQGQHIYFQWAVLGTTGAATRMLDVNIQ